MINIIQISQTNRMKLAAITCFILSGFVTTATANDFVRDHRNNGNGVIQKQNIGCEITRIGIQDLRISKKNKAKTKALIGVKCKYASRTTIDLIQVDRSGKQSIIARKQATFNKSNLFRNIALKKKFTVMRNLDKLVAKISNRRGFREYDINLEPVAWRTRPAVREHRRH
jgi:hypothetical protein